MLRRAENVAVFYQRDVWGLLTGRVRISLHVGRKQHLSPSRMSKAEFREMETRSANEPVAYLTISQRTYWRFAGQWHTDGDGLSAADVHALLTTRAMRRQDQVSRARTIAAQGRLPEPAKRGVVAPDVRQLVWNRDAGRCRACSATTELQYDHIIPVSRGGSDDPQNLQILCGPCNRRKSASVA